MTALVSVLSTIWEKLSGSKVFWTLLIALFAYLGWKRLTKPTDEAFLEKPIPNGGKDIPTNWTPDAIVERFHVYYTSWFPDSDYQGVTLALANELTDGQFFMVAQTYNAKHAKKDGLSIFGNTSETLWKRVNSWKRILLGQGVDEQKKFIDRMMKLKVNY